MTSKLYITRQTTPNWVVWASLVSKNLQKDKACLEKVQRRATKMVKGLKKLPYETKLKRLGIYTLKRRRLRRDLIETFKIFTWKVRIDFYIRQDVTQHYDKTSSASGSSMNKTNSHSLSLKHHLSTPSETGWTSTGEIWVTTANMATQPINLKYKYK